MSLILDALKRAEDERKNNAPVPDLNTQHRPLALASDAEPRPWLWYVIAGLLGIVALVIVVLMTGRWLMVDKSPTATSASSAIAAKSPEKITVQTAAVTTKAAPSSFAPSTADPAVANSTPATSVATSAGADTAAEVTDLYAQEATDPAIEADVNQLYAAEESTGSESIVDPFASLPVAQAEQSALDQSPAEVVREPARTFDSVTHIQDFNELPWNTKQKMPTISYQRHDYLAGGISSVVINGQTLGVGNIVATGQFVVQDILVDGVVLKHGDRVFKLRALNGWINM